MRRGEIVLAAFVIALSVALWIGSANYKTYTGLIQIQTVSPAAFPRLVAMGMGICGFLLLIRVSLTRTSKAIFKLGPTAYRVPLALSVMFFQVFTFEALGWILSSGISLMLLLTITRVPWLKSFFITTGLVVFIYIFLVKLLEIVFPKGIIWILLGWN